LGEFDSEGATQVRAFAFVGADRILVADADENRCDWVRHSAGVMFQVEEVSNARDALARLTGDPPKVFVVGTALADVTGEALLAYAARHRLLGVHRPWPVVFLLSDTPQSAPAVDEQQIPIFFRLVPTLQPERVRELFNQALARTAQLEPASRADEDEDPDRTRRLVEHMRKLGLQRSVKPAAEAVIEAVIDVVHADRARCLYYDDEHGSLWSELDEDSDAPASIGLAGFAARAGTPIVLERASADPAYQANVDDPSGIGDERLVIQPVVDRDRRVQAVLIAVRAATSPAFSPADVRAFGELATSWSPYIHQLASESETAAEEAEVDEGAASMFRQEAIDHMIRRGARGDVVRIHPGWIHGAFWLVLAAMGALVGYSAIARIHEYAEGPSVVRVTGLTDSVAYDGGSVTSVEVVAGQQVTEGQVMIRLHDTEQASKMRGLDAEFERKLIAYLQAPSDPAMKASLSTTRADRDNAKANLDARVIHSPHDGIVRDVLVSVGQKVEAGKVVARVARKGVPEGLSVLAFLPGSDRPRLHAGQLLRMTLPGYRGAEVEAQVFGIGSEVMGANEAKARYLADRLGDSVPIQGSVIVVEAKLPKTFVSDGRTYEFHDGMVGSSEVRLQSKTVLQTAIGVFK